MTHADRPAADLAAERERVRKDLLHYLLAQYSPELLPGCPCIPCTTQPKEDTTP